jgi:hypothetical protein
VAGIGDSWGTKEELLHPRGPDGRWIRKAGIAKSIIGAVLDFLANFRPRTFQNKQQANQYLQNISHKAPRRFTSRDYVRLRSDLPHANADLRDGVIDEPSTKTFVDMMDQHATELPDDAILTRVVPVESLGFTAETAAGTDSDTNPGIRGLSGKLIADRGYSLTTIGGVQGAQPVGTVRMVIAAKKGTKVIVPGAGPSDSTIFMDRDQPLRVTQVKPDGAGGWTMYVTAEQHRGRKVPEPIGGPVGEGRRPSVEREREIRTQQREAQRITSARMKAPDEAANAADEQRRREAAAKLPPSAGAVEEQRRRQAELEQQAQPQQPPPPGTPPPRNEPIQARSIGGEPQPTTAPGGAPQPQAPAAPQAPAGPRRAVDLRLAVRDADIPAPAAGPNRKRFNDAYEGVISGKKDPVDAVRELDRDAADLDAAGDPDADNLRRLSDVIREQYGLEKPAPAKKAAKAAIPPAPEVPPVPVAKKAPAKKAGAGRFTPEQEQALVDRAQRFRGHERNEEEQRIVREADQILARRRGEELPPVKKAVPKKAAPAKALTPLQQREQDIKGLFGGKRPTNAQLRRMGEENNLGFGPKEPRSEMILAILGARPSRGRQRGEVPVEAPAKKASREDRIADLLLERMRPDVRERILADMPENERREVEAAQARAQAAKKAAPEVPAKKVAKKAAPGPRSTEDHVAVLDGIDDREEAARYLSGVRGKDLDDLGRHYSVPPRLNAEQRRGAILDASVGRRLETEAISVDLGGGGRGRIEAVPGAKAVKKAVPAKKAAPVKKAPAKKAPAKKAAPGAPGEDLDRMTKQELIAEAGRRGVTARQSWTKDKIKGEIRRREELGEAPETPAPAKKAAPGALAPAKKAARAAVPGAAPGTANLKIGQGVSATRIRPGDVVWVEPGKTADGKPTFLRTKKKTGSFPLTVTRNERESGNNYILHGTLPDGRKVTTAGYFGQNTFYRVEGLSEGGVPEPGAAPAKKAAKVAKKAAPVEPDLEEAARTRQGKIDRARGYGNLGTEIEELVHNDASTEALKARVRSRAKREGIPDAEIQPLLDAIEGPDRDQVRVEAQRLTDREGVVPIEHAGDTIKFDPKLHQGQGGGQFREGDTVQVVRPGHRARIDGEDVQLAKAVVDEPDTPGDRGPDLVPKGSVAGPRTTTPVDNAPRKRELRQAWIRADLPTPPPGSGRKSQDEIKGDVLAGRITPEEGIRRFESEIAFGKEDLAEVDAHLRETDLSPAERAKVERHRANLQATIDSHEAQSKFLRNYFKDETPTVKEVEAKLDAEGFRALQDATPDTLREAAREMKMDPPKGDTKEEILQDLVRQMATRVAKERGLIGGKPPAKKAAKVAKKTAPEAPKISPDREKLEVAVIGAGIDFDPDDKWTNSALDIAQRALNGEQVGGLDKNPTPAAVGRYLEQRVRAMQDHASIQYGKWTDSIDAGAGPPDAEELAHRAARDAELERLRGNAAKVQELAERLKKTRRRPAKKAAAKAAPEVKAAEARADSVEARLINEHLEQLNSAKTREKAQEALDGLTMPELRRIGEQMGIKGRSKQDLRDKIVDRVKPEIPEPPTPGPGGGARQPSLARRAKDAGVIEPGEHFSDVQAAVSRADRRLQNGDSSTEVARELRERAAQVAKADLVEEGRRFKIEYDNDSLRNIRKANAEYLRRVATHVQQEGKAAPVKKAAKATPPVKKTAPTTQAERAARLQVIRGEGRGGGRAVAPPEGSRRLTVVPEPGAKSTTPEIKNDWGMLGTGGPVEFHDDGVIGTQLQRMRDDRLIDVDGEPLSNVVGKLATRAVRGQISQQQLIDELKRLEQRLPQGSPARRGVANMIRDLDAPQRAMPDLPEGTLAPLRTLVQDLLKIPLAREAVDRPGFHRSREDSEVDKVLRLLEDFREGRIGGLRFIGEFQNVRLNLPHESQEGRFEADRAIGKAVKALQALYDDKDTRRQLIPAVRQGG